MSYLALLERYPGFASGQDYRMPCPFHHEKKPSLYVSIERGTWHCFGCERSGWLHAIVAEFENTNFTRANEIISNYERMNRLPDSREFKRTKSSDRKADYMGIPEMVFDEFMPVSSDNVIAYLKARGFSKKQAREIDLREGGVLAREWRNRVIYAIRDSDGKIVSIEGRSIDASNPLRYFKLKGSESSRGLFNAHRLSPGNGLFIVEGVFDFMAMHKSGFRAVPLCSSDISDFQVKQLKKLCTVPVVILDGVDRLNQNAVNSRAVVLKRLREQLAGFFPKYAVFQIDVSDADPNDLLIRKILKKYLSENVFSAGGFNRADFLLT